MYVLLEFGNIKFTNKRMLCNHWQKFYNCEKYLTCKIIRQSNRMFTLPNENKIPMIS